ncbi:hypothetical protein CC2G_011042 [Coprinopsis cinerea AmutBmut pab1-1]|nr:hypothetical protein CC2G_011042 [Coprinopsis cinerea AmutBmut pab1-1]
MRCLASAPDLSHIQNGEINKKILGTKPNEDKPQVAPRPILTFEELQNANNPSPRIPVVKLNVDKISDTLAARLATSLLAMVLFLKNQTPLPVQQLCRMSGKNTNTKAAKQRTELLNAFDTLSSHLTTTFTALSTALARSSSKENNDASPVGHRAYVAILLGPSLGTAKSKVFLGVDQFDARIWGMQEEQTGGNDEEEAGSDEDEDTDEDDESGSEAESGDEEATSDEEGPSDSESEGSEGESDGESDDEDGSDNDGGSSHTSETEEATSKENEKILAIEVPRGPRIVAPPTVSFAEEQRFLQNAERLLSRTLAAADASGYGLASEMPPTQIHLLIRAPRDFSHPAWIPRQNVTQALDTNLAAFLAESGIDASCDTIPPAKGPKKQQKPEGVWLANRDGLNSASQHSLNADQEDMIWWSWDGKLVGFADW